MIMVFHINKKECRCNELVWECIALCAIGGSPLDLYTPRCRRPKGTCPLWYCTSLTCRYVAGKGLGSACIGVFNSLLAGGGEVCVSPWHHGVLNGMGHLHEWAK